MARLLKERSLVCLFSGCLLFGGSLIFFVLFLSGEGFAKIVYATPRQVMKQWFPKAEIRSEQIHLTPEQKKMAYRLLGRRFKGSKYWIYIGYQDQRPVAYGVVVHVIGKELPITFLVVVDGEGRVLGVDVLVFREDREYSVRKKMFLRQFQNKTIRDPLRIGKDVDALSGATLSSKAASYAVRKALAIVHAVYQIPLPSP